MSRKWMSWIQAITGTYSSEMKALHWLVLHNVISLPYFANNSLSTAAVFAQARGTLITMCFLLTWCISSATAQESPSTSPAPKFGPFVDEKRQRTGALIMMGVAVIIVFVLGSVPIVRDRLHAWATRRVHPEPIEQVV